MKNKKRMHKNYLFHLKFRATIEKEIKLEELKVAEQSIHLIVREVTILKFYFKMILWTETSFLNDNFFTIYVIGIVNMLIYLFLRKLWLIKYYDWKKVILTYIC